MRPTGFELTHQCRVLRESLQDIDVRDRLLPGPLGPAAAAAIAAIADQPGADRSWGKVTGHDRDVPADDRVRFELPAQLALGADAPSEHHEPTRFLVQPVNDP